MGWGRLVLAALAGSACSTAGSGSYLTLRTIGETREMGPESDGGVRGARFQLRPTREGYWGTSGDALVDMNADGPHIVGVLGDHPINLHLQVEGDALRLQGLFAGRIGSMTIDRQGLSSWLGGCYYDLQAAGARFEGMRTCRARRGLAEPVSIDIAPGFEALPAERRAMLLALLLGG
jgi:hypothetical protein